MLLTGEVKNVDRMIAKRDGDAIEEKRAYKIQVKPSSKQDAYHYGYGTLNFIIHGQEMMDLGIDLGDRLEITVRKAGEEYDGREIEMLRAQLYAAQQEAATAHEQARKFRKQIDQGQETMDEKMVKLQALQLENVRQLTELTTLKTMLQTGDLPGMIEARKS